MRTDDAAYWSFDVCEFTYKSIYLSLNWTIRLDSLVSCWCVCDGVGDRCRRSPPMIMLTRSFYLFCFVHRIRDNKQEYCCHFGWSPQSSWKEPMRWFSVLTLAGQQINIFRSFYLWNFIPFVIHLDSRLSNGLGGRKSRYPSTIPEKEFIALLILILIRHAVMCAFSLSPLFGSLLIKLSAYVEH